MNVTGVGRDGLTFTLQQLVEYLERQLNESQNTAQDDAHACAPSAAGDDVDRDDAGFVRESDAFDDGGIGDKDDGGIGDKDDGERRHRGTRRRVSASSALISPAAPCSHLHPSRQQPKANLGISNNSSVCARAACPTGTPSLRSTRSSNNIQS